ncbi:MAG: hypothetical protein ACREBV_03335 [Candidatus Zixiibacteriota bacterium]
MKRLTLLGLSLIVAAAIALIFGCSSDSPTETEFGDTNSIEFQLVQAVVVNNSIQDVGNIVDLSWELFDSIPGVSPSPKSFSSRAAQSEDIIVVDSFNYSYAGGWHVFAFWARVTDTAEGDTADVSGIDSLQALDNEVPQQIPDSTTDELYIRAHYDVALRNTNIAGSADDSVDIENIDWSGLNPTVIEGTVTENLQGTVSDSEVVIDFNFTNTLIADSIVANIGSEDCPSTGLLVLNSSIDISAIRTIGASVDTLNINGDWEVSATFNNGDVTVTYYDGTTYWQTTETCGFPSVSPISRWVPNLD